MKNKELIVGLIIVGLLIFGVAGLLAGMKFSEKQIALHTAYQIRQCEENGLVLRVFRSGNGSLHSECFGNLSHPDIHFNWGD